MTISDLVREQVRQRANFTCEYCGVSETDIGSTLTIDHFCPPSQGGGDILENLIYCCARCNEHKSDYWPLTPDDSPLWNPRLEPQSKHFIQLEDGRIHPLTAVAAFTLKRLRLNRPALIAHRLYKQNLAEDLRLAARYRDVAYLLDQLLTQQRSLLEEQRALLKEYQEIIQLLLNRE